MKKQTLLKLILCFLIIFVGINVQKVSAATLCSSCNFSTIENGKCIWKEQATGTLVHSLDVIDVGNGKFYHKENINCSGCPNSTAVYCSKYMGNGRFDNEYKCLAGNSLIKIDGGYYHQLSIKCPTHKVNVAAVADGYKCPNDSFNFLFADSNGNVAHKIASCSTCTDGDILNYGSDGYKCTNGSSTVNCVAAGTEYYHKVGSCASACNGTIYKDAAGIKYCSNGEVRVDDSNRHITRNNKCSTCNKDDAITNGICSTGKAIHTDGSGNWHIADKECPYHGIVVDKGSEVYICVNTKQSVIWNDGEFKHGDSFHDCGTCSNKIIDGKCSKTGLEVIEYIGSDDRFRGEDYHVVGKCNQNGTVIDMKVVGLYCNTHKLSVDSNYYHAPVETGGGNPGGTTVVVGGPSAEAFFNAGKDNAKKGYDAVDGKIEPLLHIQSMIMMAGIYIAVIVVLIYACQWMLATPGKRQELKASLWPLVIGVILLVMGPKLAILIVNTLIG